MYFLPTHPSLTSADPLGVCDADLDRVPQAAVLDCLMKTAQEKLPEDSIQALSNLIQDVVYSLHGNGDGRTYNLNQVLNDLVASRDFDVHKSLQSVIQAAQNLSSSWPDGTITHLGEDSCERIECSGDQVNSLLAHQVLGSLAQPSKSTYDIQCFTFWYGAGLLHPKAVSGYIEIIFDHFVRGGYSADENFAFSSRTASDMPDIQQSDEIPQFEVITVSEESEPSQLPPDTKNPPFVLVAANAQPGPGQTATHEERLQANAPALCLSAILCPLLAESEAVITSAFPVHGTWKGHNRTARLEQLFPTDQRPLRHYILADALEMDGQGWEDLDDAGYLPDLYPANISREIKKLYAAFAGAKAEAARAGYEECIIEAPAWGCGAFGGNTLAKSVLMMIAAGLTGVKVQLALLEKRKKEVEAVRTIVEKGWSVKELSRRITSAGTRKCTETDELFEALMSPDF